MYSNLVALAEEFAHKPVTASRVLHELWDRNRQEFLDEAIRALCTVPDSPGAAHLLRLVMGDSHSLSRIADPGFLTPKDASQIATRMHACDSATDVRLLQFLTDDSLPLGSSGAATRILEIIEEISDGKRIRTILPKLLRHRDARVRSKVTLLIGRFNHNCGWLEQRLEEHDPRVRANAVESMWGANSGEALDLFLTAAADGDFRVAANGIVGLHRAGDLAAARFAQAMAKHADARFRAAAAWAMGESQDPRFLPILGQLHSEKTGLVRRNALRGMVRIRKRIAELRSWDPLKIAVNRNSETVAVEVRSPDGSFIADLLPTAFVVGVLEIVSVEKLAETYQITISGCQTQPVGIGVYTSVGIGETSLPPPALTATVHQP